jgi:hypothetical protein
MGAVVEVSGSHHFQILVVISLPRRSEELRLSPGKVCRGEHV